MNWFNRKTYPEYWEAYKDCFSISQEQNIQRIRFVVFDTETTGLNTKNDRILSIGCVAIEGLKIKVSDQLELYVKQETFNADTVKIHGLLREGKLYKIEEPKAIELFLAYIKNAVLIAHHAAFDVSMVNAALARLGLPKLKNKVIDTGHIFQKTKLDNSKTHFSLDELSQRFKIPLHDRHTACGDAYITALLFLKLCSKLLVTNSKISLKDLERPQNRVGLL
ncbi:DNA polymerase III subunit epsilon [Winogradskyella sp. J14-2]|uniref:3'-5' exonuclease n=1 Tax=Winogradskyella sp. J14-2 TaxID=1936080 RepID=UPI0009729409|nr:3'-5' exonuclease [Winogradskyella sp. J14-2]APY07218.1 DNA polymerase III subunit epsilon [Winogradskyella sp. J14-2]